MPRPRQHLLDFAPYVLPDTSAPAGKRQLHLAQNESAFGPSPSALAAAQNAVLRGRLYPDPAFTALRAAIAAQHGLSPDQIWCGSGSLELIALLNTAYLQAGDSVVTSQYSYGFFRSSAKAAEAKVITAPEPAFRVDIDGLLAAVRADTRIVFVANPGNPTGSFIPRADILKLRQNLRNDIMLILDEAYAEYVAEEDYEAHFDLVALGNTVVLRTFSKVYGLAGFRVGWGYFPPEVLGILQRIQNPNSVSLVAQAAALAGMGDQAFVAHVRQETAIVRDWFTQALKALGLNPQPSVCNFVLCRLPSASAAQALSDYLRAEGIVVRILRGYGLSACVRITLGKAAQMRDVMAVLQRYESIIN